ncbi:transcription termination factor 4, mitochondrial [Acanthochromis polyacanthus]|uniref:transcription termination factor 4, mitochondrial n=1 Tax=Acanthochromis polyacanthus TaxID=80966 RepID=UPI00223426A8|nr:transcription termination factor 4, mitochondrial [Acanthochromis polyacanthus]XP_022057799.2 transcription termination factor 4, mitochondrial [Acanthochromis polyacanthus]
MCTRVAVRQILRWGVRNATSSVFVPLQFERCYLQSLSRLLCSSAHQSTSQPNHEVSPVTTKVVPGLSLRSLIDMGFTDTQAKQIFESVSSVRGGSAAKHILSTLTVLFVLGLNPSSVQKLLEKCPELYTVKEAQLQQRISNLRKLGLVEGSLQRMVAHYPKILTVPVKTVKNVVAFLKERCLFTSQQASDILRDSPAVVLENLDQLEYKFQYVYFRMGVKQSEMVKFRLFRFPLDEVRCRHIFLERRGFYQTPDKKGQTTIINPKLDSILNNDLDTFLTHVAQATAEEFDVFQKLLAREWKEEELQQGKIEAESADDNDEEEDDDDGDHDDDDDDDDDDEEQTGGKRGYGKRRKK